MKAMEGTSNFCSENWGRIYSPVPVVSNVKVLTLVENLLAPSTSKKFFFRAPRLKKGKRFCLNTVGVSETPLQEFPLRGDFVLHQHVILTLRATC